jgi:glycosyltransferase involved in cell wall biosynthesis
LPRVKVLHVYKECYPVLGGIENHIRILCDALREQGEFDPTILVTNQGARTVRDTLDGVPVIRAGRLSTISRNPISPALVYELWRSRAQIIHLHFPHPTGEIAYLLAGRGRKMVLYYHSDIVRQQSLLQMYRPFMNMTLDSASRIMVSSPNYARTSPHLSAFAPKIDTVPLGIDIAHFATVNHRRVERIKARLPGPLLLFVGVLRYYKGLNYLLEAMPQIKAKLLIIGSGPLDAELRHQAEELGLGAKVVFLGEVPNHDLAAYYHACDVFVLPSSQRSEAFGLSQIEAMACGKPVICTELGTGTTYVNIDGETGLVVPPANPVALAEACNRLLEDVDLRLRLGRQAAIRAKQEFGKDKMVASISEVYRRVLESG